MRRYTITVNEKTRVIDVEAVGANLFRVHMDGRLVDVTLEDHRDLQHIAPITPGVQTRPRPSAVAAASAVPDAGTSAPAAPAASRPTAGRPAAAAPAASGGGARDKMTAPMPGVILTVDVAVGATVKRGDSLMVLEAMKMKNELKAPRDGVVAEVYVAPGAQVKYGEFLVRFEG